MQRVILPKVGQVPLHVRTGRIPVLAHAMPAPPVAPSMTPRRSRKKRHDSFRITFEPIYRVILHYTQWKDDNVIAEKVVRAVNHMRFLEGLRIAQAANLHGSSIVVTTNLDQASVIEERLRLNGLRATVEVA